MASSGTFNIIWLGLIDTMRGRTRMTWSWKPTSYTLSVIAETGERFSDFTPYVASVNDDGIVAFQATDRDGSSGAYAGDGGPIRVIADPSTAPFRGVCSHPDINGEGSSCFYADIESERRGVFSVRDGEVVLVADSAGPLGPTMNEAGSVAFRADLSGGSSGVFTASGGSVATIAEADGRFRLFHGLPVIDAVGTVTFRADLEGGGEGIYAADSEQVTAIVETGDTFSGLGLFPVSNDAGVVAFCAQLQAGGSGVFTAASGEIETVIDASGPFESFRGVLINDAGDLLFYATPRGGTLGAFAGPDPLSDRVLSVHSPLFGSSVVDFALNPVSINRAGQIAIRVGLEDQRQFIIRADPGRRGLESR
jgi:hypothetical protein